MSGKTNNNEKNEVVLLLITESYEILTFNANNKAQNDSLTCSLRTCCTK